MNIPKGYEVTEDGVLRQLNPVPILYDEEYVKKPNHMHETTAFLRVGYLAKYVPLWRVEHVLDYGAGPGIFARTMEKIIDTYVYDVVRVPELSDIFEEFPEYLSWDLVTFFDSLEHCLDIQGTVRKLDTKYICISVPWCHSYEESWLREWRHFKPHEHLWYFNQASLLKFMGRMGYTCIYSGNVEDCLRTPQYKNLPNILTGIFKKK